MEELLFSFADFAEYKHTPPALEDDERLQTALLNVQRTFLRDLLGRALYYDLVNNRSLAKYVNLLDGTTYTVNGATVEFYGIKPAMLWQAWANMIQEIAVVPTRAGLKVKQATGGGQDVDQHRLDSEKQRAYQQADMYAQEVVEFLEANKTTYSLWQKRENDAPKKAMGIEIVTQARNNFTPR